MYFKERLILSIKLITCSFKFLYFINKNKTHNYVINFYIKKKGREIFNFYKIEFNIYINKNIFFCQI